MDDLLKDTVDLVLEKLGDDIDDITVERAVFGLFFSGVKISTGHGGLCFTPVKEMPEAVCCPSSAMVMPLSGKLSGVSVKQYLDDIFCDNVLRRTLGIAALNALSNLIWENNDSEYEPEMGIDAFDEIDVTKYEKTVVVGALIPMLKKLIANGNDFTILEQDPRTLKDREMKFYAPSEDAYKYVPDADLLVITGVTILNGTLSSLLEMAKPEAEILITGPTASMLPDVFFKNGVTMTGGIVVTKADELLDIISEAGSGYHFFGQSAERAIIKK
ncbi:MAG: DUF364 domain-containing protein [Methanobrevibacter sp.]|nr:DUF364 domain-containing protein [Methanobrevibacter sp.]